MDLENMSFDRVIFGFSVFVFEICRAPGRLGGGGWGDFELRAGHLWIFSKRPDVAYPEDFSRNSPRVGIYTDAAARELSGKGEINWISVVGVGGFPS